MDEQQVASRAYSSTCSFGSSKVLTKEEQKLTEKDFYADREKKLAAISGQAKVKNEIRKNIIVGGKFPQAKVEEVLKNITEVPPELVKAYVDLQKSAIKFRISEDADYKIANQPNAQNPKEQFESLKKL